MKSIVLYLYMSHFIIEVHGNHITRRYYRTSRKRVGIICATHALQYFNYTNLEKGFELLVPITPSNLKLKLGKLWIDFGYVSLKQIKKSGLLF